MQNIKSIFLLTLLMTACGSSEEDPVLVLPSNLEININNSADGSGKITVTATADNTNFYNIYFGEGSNETPVKTTEGVASHTYSSSGTFTIKVQAHATSADFVSDTKDVNILLSGDDFIPTTGYTSPTSYASMDLVWQDEFDGTSLNATNWTFETGGHGWGNNELQYYRNENTEVRDGYLIITAKKETYMGSDYTSSRIITKDKKTFQYGRVDVRAALPEGQGIWPALWMLGSNFSTAGWPACGEIDIMEMIGGAGRENTVHGTAHWDNDGAHASYGDKRTLSSGTYHDEFHVFSIVWTANSITWYVDDVQYNVIDITPTQLSEFRNSFFFIFNIAVGGNWPGSPDGSTQFPQHMVVDYIRVFQPQ